MNGKPDNRGYRTPVTLFERLLSWPVVICCGLTLVAAAVFLGLQARDAAQVHANEEQIRKLMARAADDAARHDSAAIMKIVSRDFHGPDGTTYDNAQTLITSVFRQEFPGGIRMAVTPVPLKVVLDSDTDATVTFQISAQGKADSSADWENIAARYGLSDRTVFKAHLTRNGDDWKISGVDAIVESKSTGF